MKELKCPKANPNDEVMDFVQRKMSITDNPNHLKSYRSASQNVHHQIQNGSKFAARRLSQQSHANFQTKSSKFINK